MAIPVDIQIMMVKSKFIENVYQNSIYRIAGMDLTSDLVGMGSSIKIPRLMDNTAKAAYTKYADVSLTRPDSADKTLTITKDEVFGIEFDEADEVFTRQSVFSQYLRDANMKNVQAIDDDYRTYLLSNIPDNAVYEHILEIGTHADAVATNFYESKYYEALTTTIWKIKDDTAAALWQPGETICYLHPQQAGALGRYFVGRDFRIKTFADQVASGQYLDSVWGMRFIEDVLMPTTGTDYNQMLFLRNGQSFAHAFKVIGSRMDKLPKQFTDYAMMRTVYGYELLDYAADSGSTINPRAPRFVISHQVKNS